LRKKNILSKYTIQQKVEKIIIPSNSIQNIDNNNIETYIDDFIIKETLKNDITSNILNNNLKYSHRELEKQHLKQFLDIRKIENENVNYNSEKLKIEKIIKPIIDNVLIKTMGIIKNNILGKEIEKRKELELKKLENMELNNKIMQNILESKEETNMFGYNINNSDELKKIYKGIS